MSAQDVDWWHPDMGMPIDAELTEVPAFEFAGYRSTSSGKVELRQPNEAMRVIHNRFLGVIGRCWRKGEGYEYEAWRACIGNYHYFYVLDLEDAFGHVPQTWLTNFVARECSGWLGDDEVEQFVSRYLMSPGGGLVQGAPASPALFEYFAATDLDFQLISQLNELNYLGFRCGYVRYVDDLVFMSYKPLPEAYRRILKEIVRQAGMCINEKKARGVVLRKNTLTLTGVSIRRTSSGVRMFMPRDKLRRLEGLLHHANRGGAVNMLQIEGLMSAFLAVTSTGHLNATELRVVRAYEQLTGKKVGGQRYPRFVRVKSHRSLRRTKVPTQEEGGTIPLF
jgi:hypothetical protein